jgi:hypothetical protein
VAVGLDRDHARRVADLRFATDDGAVVVEVVPQPDQDVALELYSANERTGLLATALERPVEVVAVA